MEGGRLSHRRHCRKGALLMPKAVHRSGCRDKHNWPRTLTPQSIMPSLNHCDLLRHLGVNNLPKVVTRQRRGRKLNSQPSSYKFNAITTRIPSLCLFTPYMLPHLSFFLRFFLSFVLPYLSFPMRIDSLHFEARGHKRRPNLGFLVVLVYFVF